VRTSRPRFVLTCLIVCMVCALAHANVIQLRDGSKLKGELLKRSTTELHLKVDGLDLFVPKKDVAAIDGKDLATDYTGMLQERLHALTPGDADARRLILPLKRSSWQGSSTPIVVKATGLVCDQAYKPNNPFEN